MRVFPAQLFIMRLTGTLPSGEQFEWVKTKSPEECIEGLRKISGRDFGLDLAAWEQWWREEKKARDIDPEF